MNFTTTTTNSNIREGQYLRYHIVHGLCWHCWQRTRFSLNHLFSLKLLINKLLILHTIVSEHPGTYYKYNPLNYTQLFPKNFSSFVRWHIKSKSKGVYFLKSLLLTMDIDIRLFLSYEDKINLRFFRNGPISPRFLHYT